MKTRMGGRGREEEEEEDGKTRTRTRTGGRASPVLIANVFFVFLKSTSVDDGTFRRSSLAGSLTDHARGGMSPRRC